MNIYKLRDKNNGLTQDQLHAIILQVGNRINLFSGNCGIFAIALSKFLKQIGNYNSLYFIYTNFCGNDLDSYLYGEPDVYHVILSVEGSGIDGFFDGHGECETGQISSILSEYGETFSTVTTVKLPSDDSMIETFIRNNTNYDSSSINETSVLNLLNEEYLKIKHDIDDIESEK